MKILLLRARHHNFWEPLSLLYLAAYIRDRMPRIEVKVMDEAVDGEQSILDEAESSHVVGITASSPMLSRALYLADRIKERDPGIRVVLGGYGPSLQPEKCTGPSVDHVVVGEGEEALRLILAGEMWNQKVIRQPPILDLDSIPWPARDLVDMEQYIGIAQREEGQRVTSVVSERGCNFRCAFCGSGYGMHESLRMRKPEKVVDEMEHVRKLYNIEYMKFSDAETNCTRDHFIDLCSELHSRGWRTPWGCNMRVDKVDDALCSWASKAKCHEFDFGVESGSNQILLSYGKGITTQMTKKAFKVARRHGITRRAQIILGAPMETRATIRKTEMLLDEIEPDIVAFTILAPYPGTAYYSDEKYGDVDWSTVDNYGNKFWRSERLSNEQLREEQARLMQRFRDRLPPIVARKKRLGVIE